jgi:outer membrane protein OmpA-like peptidoglycan-associated protein
MPRRLALGWPLLALGACASAPVPLTSTLPAAAAPVSFVGAPAGALAPAAVGPELDALQAQLGDLAGWGAAVPLDLLREEAGLRLRFGVDESFTPGSAELRPSALSAYAGLARAVAARPGVVAHVRVLGELSPEPEVSLPARRAASLQSYLGAKGVPATRLRAHGAAGAGTVEVLVRPIVAGREAEAWVPPS